MVLPFKKCIVKIGGVCMSSDNRKPFELLRTRVMIRGEPWSSNLITVCYDSWSTERLEAGHSWDQISALLRGYEIYRRIMFWRKKIVNWCFISCRSFYPVGFNLLNICHALLQRANRYPLVRTKKSLLNFGFQIINIFQIQFRVIGTFVHLLWQLTGQLEAINNVSMQAHQIS